MESENFKIEYPESLVDISKRILDNLNQKQRIIFNFFGISTFEKVNIKLFDNIESYRNYFNDPHMPEYSVGCIRGNSIYAVINPKIDINSNSEEIRVYRDKNITRISHEFVHVIYNNHIVKKRKQNRITWFDEGLAQCLSGQYTHLEKGGNFENFFQFIKSLNPVRPNLNYLVHRVVNLGEKPFKVVGKYNGYDLSFIAVKYMFETMGKQRVRYLMENENELLKVGNTVINDAVEYYEKKYFGQYGRNSEDEER